MNTLSANMKTGHCDQQAYFCPVLYTLTLFKDESRHTVELGYSGGRLLERLIQAPGQVIDRETLVAYAWSDRVVGPGSLNQQVYTLRKMLGDEKNLQIIQTVPRRGYRFNPAFIIEKTPEQPLQQPATPALEQVPVMAAPVRSGLRRKAMAISATLAVITGYFFASPSTELYASLQKTGNSSVVYVEQQQPKVNELISKTRALSERMINLSEEPVELAIVGSANGYYRVHCSHTTGTNNTLILHANEIQSVSDTRLLSCVQ